VNKWRCGENGEKQCVAKSFNMHFFFSSLTISLFFHCITKTFHNSNGKFDRIYVYRRTWLHSLTTYCVIKLIFGNKEKIEGWKVFILADAEKNKWGAKVGAEEQQTIR